MNNSHHGDHLTPPVWASPFDDQPLHGLDPQGVLDLGQLHIEGAPTPPEYLTPGVIWAGEAPVSQGLSVPFHFQAAPPLGPDPGVLSVRAAAMVARSGEGCLIVEEMYQPLSRGDIISGHLQFSASIPGLHTFDIELEYINLYPWPERRRFTVATRLYATTPPPHFDLYESPNHPQQLRWREAPGAQSYEVFAVPLIEGRGRRAPRLISLGEQLAPACSLDLARCALPPGTYDWFVVARNTHGATLSQRRRRFTLS